MNKRIALALMPVFFPSLPPLNLAVLSGYIAKNGFFADILDFNNYFFNKADAELKKEWMKSCNKILEQTIFELIKNRYQSDFDFMVKKFLDYDVIGFSCYKSNFDAVQKIAVLLKSINPKIKIILGGPEIASQYFKLKNAVTEKYSAFGDFFVVGEGEQPLLNYLTEKNNAQKLAVFDELKDINNLPEPNFSNINFTLYPKSNVIPLLFSRGCIRKCKFCSERLLHARFRVTSSETVINHIKTLKKRGIEYFVFYDSLINGDLKALENLCDGIIKNFGSIKWEAQIAIRKDMPDRLFEKIKQSGCYNLFVGLESGCEKTIKNMNKGFSTQDAVNFFSKLNYHNLSFGVSIIIGFPNETYNDFIESLNFLIQNKHLIKKIEQVNPFVCYDGTGFEKNADYKNNPESIARTDYFIQQIKKEGFKYTKAYMKNLLEIKWK